MLSSPLFQCIALYIGALFKKENNTEKTNKQIKKKKQNKKQNRHLER